MHETSGTSDPYEKYYSAYKTKSTVASATSTYTRTSATSTATYVTPSGVLGESSSQYEEDEVLSGELVASGLQLQIGEVVRISCSFCEAQIVAKVESTTARLGVTQTVMFEVLEQDCDCPAFLLTKNQEQ